MPQASPRDDKLFQRMPNSNSATTSGTSSPLGKWGTKNQIMLLSPFGLQSQSQHAEHIQKIDQKPVNLIQKREVTLPLSELSLCSAGFCPVEASSFSPRQPHVAHVATIRAMMLHPLRIPSPRLISSTPSLIRGAIWTEASPHPVPVTSRMAKCA